MDILKPFRRAPKVKENPVWPAMVSIYGGTPYLWAPKDYKSLAKAGYQSVAVAFGCVSTIARASASIDWYVTKGGNEDESSPLLKLLKRPNELCSRSRFIQEIVSYYLLAGNSYVLKVGGSEGSTAPPRFLYTLRPDRMRIKPDPETLVGQYIYDVGGQMKTFKPSEVLHLFEFHPTDDFYGLSRFEVAAKSIDIANLSMEWNANILHRDMRLPGALKVDGTLTKDQREQLHKDLEKYQGAENAGKIPIFEGGTGGMEWQAMAANAKEMDWLDSEKYNTRRICSVLGVPSQLMGDTESTTYANYQEARAALYHETVLPMMDLLRDEFNYWLAPLYGDNVELEYDRDSIEAIQEDRGQKYAYIAQSDWMSVNEKREATGYEPLNGEIGKVVLVGMGKMPLEQVVAELEPMTDDDEPEDTPQEPGEVDNVGQGATIVDEDDDEDAEQEKSSVAPPVRKSSFWTTEPERKAALWKAFDRRIAAQEKQFAPLIKKYLREQADRIAKRYEAGAPVSRLMDIEAETAAYVKRFFPFYERAFRLAMTAGLHAAQGKLWDPSEDDKAAAKVPTPEQLTKLRAQIEKSAKYFNTTTFDIVKASVELGVTENLTTQGVSQSVRDALDSRAPWESRRIAATEMTRTDGWGSVEGYKENPDVDMKGWNCQMLDTSREDHIDADGQEVLVDDDFDIGGESLAYPGDHRASAGNVCNCRCSTYPVVGQL